MHGPSRMRIVELVAAPSVDAFPIEKKLPAIGLFFTRETIVSRLCPGKSAKQEYDKESKGYFHRVDNMAASKSVTPNLSGSFDRAVRILGGDDRDSLIGHAL